MDQSSRVFSDSWVESYHAYDPGAGLELLVEYRVVPSFSMGLHAEALWPAGTSEWVQYRGALQYTAGGVFRVHTGDQPAPGRVTFNFSLSAGVAYGSFENAYRSTADNEVALRVRAVVVPFAAAGMLWLSETFGLGLSAGADVWLPLSYERCVAGSDCLPFSGSIEGTWRVGPQLGLHF